jgi:hypothetical protein
MFTIFNLTVLWPLISVGELSIPRSETKSLNLSRHCGRCRTDTTAYISTVQSVVPFTIPLLLSLEITIASDFIFESS